MYRPFQTLVTAGVFLVSAPLLSDVPPPAAVSPGSPTTSKTLAQSCPTFSWATVAEATGYQLVIYEVIETGELQIHRKKELPRGATSWTPSGSECPEAGSHYAWVVRARGEEGASPWSPALLFENAGRPSEDELRRAIEVIQRYHDTRSARRAPRSPGPHSLPGESPGDSYGNRPRQDQPKPLRAAERPPLTTETIGARHSVRTVSGASALSLDLDGDLDLGGFVFKDTLPFLHNDGGTLNPNTALGLNALISATPGVPYAYSGEENTAIGYSVLKNNSTGWSNTGIGHFALLSNTTGVRNTASGKWALLSNSTGSNNTAVGAFGLDSNTTGSRNTSVGHAALNDNQGGSDNTAVGQNALGANVSACCNTATGSNSLFSNTSGQRNTVSGYRVMFTNTTGYDNTATGFEALFSNEYGTNNTAIGQSALYNTLGSSNTGIGTGAGQNWTYGFHNIAVGAGSNGVAGESGTIRIGGGDLQTDTFIEGINGAISDDKVEGFSVNVCIDQFDQLGPCVVTLSSRRFKDEIEAMGSTTALLNRLRPVSFRYKPGSYQDVDVRQYGLIAEEVAEVLPTLVDRDDSGTPYAVRYDLLTPILLNEIQLQRQELRMYRGELDRLRVRMSVREREVNGTR